MPSLCDVAGSEDRFYRAARDGEQIRWFDSRGQSVVSSWHPPELPAPEGKSHGSGGICFTREQHVVLVSRLGVAWEFPQGRPQGSEDWRATLDREVFEEACARVQKAMLLGFVKSAITKGADEGLVLVRSLWSAKVILEPWVPRHETINRTVVPSHEALERLKIDWDVLPIYKRWLREALKAVGLV